MTWCNLSSNRFPLAWKFQDGLLLLGSERSAVGMAKHQKQPLNGGWSMKKLNSSPVNEGCTPGWDSSSEVFFWVLIKCSASIFLSHCSICIKAQRTSVLGNSHTAELWALGPRTLDALVDLHMQFSWGWLHELHLGKRRPDMTRQPLWVAPFPGAYSWQHA